MIQPSAEKNCMTCIHFRKGMLASEGWHCKQLTREQLTAAGYTPPVHNANVVDGVTVYLSTPSLDEFVCDEWEPP